mmetsp:Transcript_5396/g.7105  ORF Transcript_5396/g.7105 Transcript_5396/m.7105 type:complete len:208 (+) Transcript_5396:28-651(+)
MPGDDEKPKVRGRGSAKFGSAFGGSGLLAWTGEDPKSAPSELALNPRRSSRSRSPREKAERAKKAKLLDGPLERSQGNKRGQWKGGNGERPRREPRSKWIKVTNIPKVAKSQHIRHLFSRSSHKVLECIVDDGVAFMSFERFEHAAAAVKQYDGGDINGTKIAVQLEFKPPGQAGEGKEAKKEAKPTKEDTTTEGAEDADKDEEEES